MTIEGTLRHLKQILGRELTGLEALIAGIAYQSGISYQIESLKKEESRNNSKEPKSSCACETNKKHSD